MALTLEEKRKERLTTEWEGLCVSRSGCGTACCYHEGSACEHLKIIDKKSGAGVCNIYEKRFGWHSTVSGKRFECVPMRAWLLHKTPPRECGYWGIGSIENEKTDFGKRSFTV